MEVEAIYFFGFPHPPAPINPNRWKMNRSSGPEYQDILGSETSPSLLIHSYTSILNSLYIPNWKLKVGIGNEIFNISFNRSFDISCSILCYRWMGNFSSWDFILVNLYAKFVSTELSCSWKNKMPFSFLILVVLGKLYNKMDMEEVTNRCNE